MYLTAAAERLNRAEATRRRDILRPLKGKIDESDTPRILLKSFHGKIAYF